MKAVTYLATFIGGLIVCYLLLSLGVVDRVDGIPGAQAEPNLSLPTYLSFLSVLITAVTAILAALAIGIGIVAAYTFKELKDEARMTSKEVAANTAKEVTSEALSEVKVRAMVLELYAKAEKEREHKEEWGDEPQETEDR